MSTTPRIVSMADVAKAAGVSSQTVSRVSNGSDAVRSETKAKVLAAMEELGYRPNFAARALKRGKFNAIAVILFDIGATGNLRTLQGITTIAAELGYVITLVMLDWNEQPTLAQALERVKTMPVDGAIVILEHLVSDYHTFIPPQDMAITVITTEPSDKYATVDSDQAHISSTIMEYFFKNGHRHIHYVSGPADSVANTYREQGYTAAMEREHLPLPAIIRGDWTAESGYDAGLRLAATPDCTAVYAANDNMAYGVIQGLRAAGKRVPEDVSVIGVDDSLQDTVPRLELTTMRLHFGQVGKAAVETTIDAIEHPNRPITHNTIQGTLIIRGSVQSL